MSNLNQPAVLIYDFSISQLCILLASSLIQQGFSVVAVCPCDHPEIAQAARESGCAVIGSERGESKQGGMESILGDRYQGWYEGNRLRAGLEFFRKEMEGFPGIITVAAEDGYTVDDVLLMAAAMAAYPGKLITASRAANPELGWRQKFVKACAGRFFSALHGRAIQDPWAGLRAIPAAIVPALRDLKGDGRRFAFNIVLNLQHKGIKSVNVPVSARYQPGEGLERSERIKDIFRILALPFTFISASLTATAADYAVFLALDTVLMKGHWAVSITISRGTGAIVGYLLNRNLVFKRTNNSRRKELVAAAQFTLLALFNYGMSLAFVYVLHDLLFVNEIIARFCGDVILFITSYLIQREIIFKRKMPIPN